MPKANRFIFFVIGIVALLASTYHAPAYAAESISWGKVQRVTYDPLLDTIYMSNDPLHDGGLNLSTLELTTDKQNADLVINKYAEMGANGIIELKNEKLEDPSEPVANFPSLITGIKSGKIYMILLHDGSRAKVRIDTLTPAKAYLSFVLESEDDNGGGDDGGGGGDDGGTGDISEEEGTLTSNNGTSTKRYIDYTVKLTQPATLSIELSWNSKADLSLYLKDSKNETVAKSTTKGKSENIEFKAKKAGTYTIRVFAKSGGEADFHLITEIK